eukprot:jgi/Mesen1/5569/ME000280S04665
MWVQIHLVGAFDDSTEYLASHSADVSNDKDDITLSSDDVSIGAGPSARSAGNPGDCAARQLSAAYEEKILPARTAGPASPASVAQSPRSGSSSGWGNGRPGKPPPQKDGFSWPLAAALAAQLHRSPVPFILRTACLLELNTRVVAAPPGGTRPLVRDIVMDTATGGLHRAYFTRSSKGPDLALRSACLAGGQDPRWAVGLISTYDTFTDMFRLGPCRLANAAAWASQMLSKSDEELLLSYSTSPLAESPDVVADWRECFEFLRKHRDWRQVFPRGTPHVYARGFDGCWMLVGGRPR